MGDRLGHRGPIAAWREVAPQVYLGATGFDEPVVWSRDGAAGVIDPAAASGVDPQEAFESFVDGGMRSVDGLPAALAVWDDHEGTLHLGRDLVGQKPLHYCALRGGGVAFATEYKALLALEAAPVEPDVEALQYMQCHKLTPRGQTLLKGIRCAPPGAVVRLDRRGVPRSQEPVPTIDVSVAPVTEEQARDELSRRFVEAIRPLVAGRDRIGVSLSGGIDSLSVAYGSRLCAPDADLVAFTAGDDEDDPEIRIASMVMERLGGRHVPVYVTAQPLIDELPLAVWHFENPVGRTETIQSFEVGRAARQDGLEWLMCGLGSDGIFAGMPKHKILWLSELLPPIREDLREFYALTQTGRPVERPLAKLMDLLYFRGGVPPVPRVRDATYRPPPPKWPESGPEFLNHMMVANAYENLSRSLVRLERPFQAFGVDLASPFFDRNVMEYAFTLPSRLKIRRGREKYILRQAMASLVSPDLLNIPKGIARIRHDTAFAHILQQLTDQYLDPGSVSDRGWFDLDEIHRIRRHLTHGSYHAEAAMRLWTLIVTEIWARIYVDRRGQRPTS
jgi:asparagine synthase (glutamine-hydrolysing)